MSRSSLDAALDGLVASYGCGHPIDNLATHALPNRRAVIEAFVHLQHALFLGFFTTGRPDVGTLRYALAEHLLPARAILCAQVGRAAAWADRDLPASERRCEGWCADTVAGLFDQLPAIRELLRGDVDATFAHDPAAESVEEVVFSYPGIHALTAHRVAHALYQAGVPFVPRIIAEHAHARTGVDLHPGASIGERLCIDHGTGIVVGATSRIGHDVRIYQGVTLGAHSVDGAVPRERGSAPQRHPTIEDGVVIYAGATILGGTTVVGARSVIGGNVWLTRSVPPDSRILYRTPEIP
ncbi:MAG: serine acetyltransferase [Myxococcales bacterium]|nr:serine acetyltransferase [Myxococcales bacterium]MCB9692395.1 serine acetyltransferase [Alphaproteobacteria bacterium]